MNAALAIRPSRDLRNHYTQISELCREGPVAITVNGREDTVVMSHSYFCEQQNRIAELEERLSLYQHLAQAEDDIRLGRTENAEDVFDRIRKELDGYF